MIDKEAERFVAGKAVPCTSDHIISLYQASSAITMLLLITLHKHYS